MNISEKQLLDEIEKINTNDNIDSCIIQLPLPEHLEQNTILNKLDPKNQTTCFETCSLKSASAFDALSRFPI